MVPPCQAAFQRRAQELSLLKTGPKREEVVGASRVLPDTSHCSLSSAVGLKLNADPSTVSVNKVTSNRPTREQVMC